MKKSSDESLETFSWEWGRQRIFGVPKKGKEIENGHYNAKKREGEPEMSQGQSRREKDKKEDSMGGREREKEENA